MESPPAAFEAPPTAFSTELAPEPALSTAPAPTFETEASELDRILFELTDRAPAFVRVHPTDKAALLRTLVPRFVAAAADLVRAESARRSVELGSSIGAPSSLTAGAWITGPFAIVACARLLARTLDAIVAGSSDLPRRRFRARRDGRFEMSLASSIRHGAALVPGIDARVLFAPGATLDELLAGRASAYRTPEISAGVSLVVSAGANPCAAVMNALHTLFVEGKLALLALSPEDGPIAGVLAGALGPLIERGWLQIVHAAVDGLAWLAAHPAIAAVHFDGPAAVRDRLVWGSLEEHAWRRATGDPLLAKPIFFAPGGAAPVVVMPYLYATDELHFQARRVAAEIALHAELGLELGTVLVLPRCWPQKQLFLDAIQRALAALPPPFVTDAAAIERHARLVQARPGELWIGAGAAGALPWTLVPDVDPTGDPILAADPVPGLVAVVSLGCDDPIAFIAEAAAFCDERLRGSLCASLIVPPLHEEDAAIAAAVEQAIGSLRYGAVAVNTSPLVLHALAAPPWGGHRAAAPGAPARIAFTNNTLMLDQVEKSVAFAPLVSARKPAFFTDVARPIRLGERLVRCAADPSWATRAGIAIASLRR